MTDSGRSSTFSSDKAVSVDNDPRSSVQSFSSTDSSSGIFYTYFAIFLDVTLTLSIELSSSASSLQVF